MKLGYCEECETIIVPEILNPISCHCGKSWCWWIKPISGVLAVCGPISVIGIHNGLLEAKPDGLVVMKNQMEEILASTPTNYLFKAHNSLIIKFKPGATGDIEEYPRFKVDELVKKNEEYRKSLS